MQVDIRVPVGAPIPRLADFIAGCEDAGFDGVGVNDHHHTGRDVYVALAAAAMRTTRLNLYPVTSNTVTRDPVVLAALASSLAELAPGRVLLSLAPGFLSVEKAGRARAPFGQLRQAVGTVRALLGGAEVSINGRGVRLLNRPAQPPKVYLLASGPRLLEAAGEVADGVMMLVGFHPAAVARARGHIRAGAARAGRDAGDIEEIFVVPFGLGEPDVASQWPRTYFRPGLPWLSYPSATKKIWLREAGITLAEDSRPEDIPASVARRICEALGLFGPPGHCAERLLRAGEEVGVRRVFLFPEHTAETSYHLPVAEVAAFRDVIGPAVRAGCAAGGDDGWPRPHGRENPA